MSTKTSSAPVAAESESTTLPTGVLVGDDGHRHSRRVVEIAVDEADRRGLPLTILVVANMVGDPDRSVGAQLRDEADAVQEAERSLGESLARARNRRPGSPISGLLLVDPDEAKLTELLAECALVVVGSRGGRGRPVFSLATTSRHLLRSVRCPLLVVPVNGSTRLSDPMRIVAGVDDGELGPQIIREAAVAAAPTGHVEVLHSYRRGEGEPPEQALARAGAACDEQIRRAASEPGVRITRLLTLESAAGALVKRAGSASLVVVGTRGPIALAGLTLDSVSRAVLESMTCPVLIVTRASREHEAGAGANG